MSFSLGRTEVRITLGAVLLPALCFVLGEGEALLCAIISLAVHEAAHAIAARNLNVPIVRFSVYPFGAVMRLDTLPTGGQGEGIVAAAGPLGSLTFAALLQLSLLILPMGDFGKRLIGTNLLIALFNLLPAFPLDGGRIFRSVLLRVVRERTARALLFAFTAVIALGMIGIGVYCIFKDLPAWTLFLIPPFLIASAISEWRMPDAGIVARMMERKNVVRSGAAQKAQIIVLRDDACIGDAIASTSKTRFTIIRVLQSDGFYELDEDRLLNAAARFGMRTPLKTVISQLTDAK